jgi:hypothetical protein
MTCAQFRAVMTIQISHNYRLVLRISDSISCPQTRRQHFVPCLPHYCQPPRSHPTTLGQASQGSTFTRYRNDCHSSCPSPTSNDTTPLSKDVQARRRRRRRRRTLTPIAPRRRHLAVLYLSFQFRICRFPLFVPRRIHSRADARQIPFNCGSTCACRVTFSLRCSTEYKGNLNFSTVGSSFSHLQSSTARIFQ